MHLSRVEVAPRVGVKDVLGERVARAIEEVLSLSLEGVRVAKVYTLVDVSAEEREAVIAEAVLHDPVLHDVFLAPPSDNDFTASGLDPSYALEVSFRPGVTDNEGKTARESLALVLKRAVAPVYTSSVYYLDDPALTREQVERIGRELLANDLIQRVRVKSREEWDAEPGFAPQAAAVSAEAVATVASVDIAAMDDEALLAFSRENVLALSLTELHAIRDYYADPEVAARRQAMGFTALPTDAELECLAQTWSEHCKHKIFASKIAYENAETGRSQAIDSLYKTFIQGPTKQLRQRMGDGDFCRSVFKDNAGVLAFTDEMNICVKVETHNSPSALDPYGGALTGIVGVNRDPMGTGLGAEMVCNTDVFCFASPYWDSELPPRLLHPRRVLEGVREGVEHGGNKSGIPTVNGSLVFHERFLGKPLVFCGTVGKMPATINGRPSHEKSARVGDAIVMMGGRIGKDGIHGATFSSEELHEGSPATAVQIGDPITQRKMYDCIMRARDRGLYNAITDNGAGGLSSSVGEMAEDTGGAHLDLSRAPLKYDGLRPWEIFLSEAQERMTLAVPPDSLDAFLALAAEMDVEATVLGTYTDSGYLHVTHGETPVALLPMDFLHEGVPQLALSARWERPEIKDGRVDERREGQAKLLSRMLARLNVCSKEYVVRQYDHEVKGGSAVKPLCGVKADGPSDAGVLRPELTRDEGLVVSHGICPKFSDHDTYWMAAGAVDEAVRNAVAAGGDIRYMAGVDNFCWCDPVTSEKTPDGAYKLAQLVRANQGLAHYCLAYGVPCVSGKDSMKNDYYGGGQKISVPPTLLFTVVGKLADVNRAMTSDFKRPGDLVYLLGVTRRELGGSELAGHLGLSFAGVPQVDAVAARERYLALGEAIRQGYVNAAHDLSDGGLAVAFAEMAMAGRVGARLNLSRVHTAPAEDGSPLTPTEILYSESHSRLLVAVPPEHKRAFEALFAGQSCRLVGEVVEGRDVIVATGDAADTTLLRERLDNLLAAWKEPLNFGSLGEDGRKDSGGCLDWS